VRHSLRRPAPDRSESSSRSSSDTSLEPCIGYNLTEAQTPVKWLKTVTAAKLEDVATNPQPAQRRSIKRIAGRLCLDFVNTVGGWVPEESLAAGRFRAVDDRLGSFADLLDWSAPVLEPALRRGIASAARRRPAAAQLAWERAVRLRAALYRLFRAEIAHSSPRPDDLALVGEEWRAARASERLVRTRRGYAVTGAPAAAHELDALIRYPLDEILRSAVELLTSRELARVRFCPGERCGWIFLDTSRTGRRRWCDMSDCGNIEKVRRYRARHAVPGG
jgi:predicted RNA-binding Zn ribbon-like protein